MLFLNCIFIFPQAEEIKRYVAVYKAPLKESTWFFAKNLGTLSLGDTVTPIREGGKWTQVKADGIIGWVLSSSLSVRRIISSGTNATAMELSLAGKGFSSELETEYRKSGLDYSVVDMMENMVIGDEELIDFIGEGRLARGQ
jgi:hypothetical protein